MQEHIQGTFSSYLETKTYDTQYRAQFVRITEDIQSAVARSSIVQGTVTVQTHHTTASLWINEDEKNLIGPSEVLGYEADLRKVLDRFADPMHEYGHNDIADGANVSGKRNTHLCAPDEHGVIHECVNGHAHAQALLFHTSLTCIVDKARVLLGQWQQIMLVELDHNRTRTVSILVQGVLG